MHLEELNKRKKSQNRREDEVPTFGFDSQSTCCTSFISLTLLRAIAKSLFSSLHFNHFHRTFRVHLNNANRLIGLQRLASENGIDQFTEIDESTHYLLSREHL